MSWHDVHVHGIRFATFDESQGTTDLVLDIDYILNWEQDENQFLFTICRAELTFHCAFGLQVSLDYATSSAGMCPFVIDGIHREPLAFPTGYRSFRWNIAINWPLGSIKFDAPSFTQRLIGNPVVKGGKQSLTSEERKNAV